MELIIFIGIPASGKSSFYKEYFFNSHIRVSLDLLNTRNKEGKLMQFCFNTHSKMVIDNNNITSNEREKYITIARNNKYKIIAYYFESNINECLERNKNRKENIPEIGVKSKYKELEKPSKEEGFEELYYVKIEDGKFIIDLYEI